MTSLLITFENFDAIWEIRNVVIAGLEISHVKFYAKIALYKLKGKLVTHDISTPAIDTKTGMCGSTSNLGQRHIRLPTHYSFEITVPLMTGTYSYHGTVPWTSLNKFCNFPKWQTLIGGTKNFHFYTHNKSPENIWKFGNWPKQDIKQLLWYGLKLHF